MKFLFALITMIAAQNVFADANCDTSRSARQAIKALVAVEDIKGVAAYYGGLESSNGLNSTYAIELHYVTNVKDRYSVIIRDRDCRILKQELIFENVPTDSNP